MTPEQHFIEVSRLHELKRQIAETCRAHDAGELSPKEAAARLIAIYFWLDETAGTTQH